MEEKQLSEQDSLRLIQEMIHTAKKEQKDDGKSWIIWGWLLFFASFLSFLNQKFHWFNDFFFWDIFGLCTILLLIYEAIRYFTSKRIDRVRTYTRDLLEKLNIGFFIFLLLIILSINAGLFSSHGGVHPVYGFALLLGLYGFWILVYGAVLNFRPSIIGAYITWGFAFASLFVNKFEHTMLLHAGAVLCGYIIPGHIANREFKKLQSKDKVVESV